jgi:hypothetical protein
MIHASIVGREWQSFFQWDNKEILHHLHALRLEYERFTFFKFDKLPTKKLRPLNY